MAWEDFKAGAKAKYEQCKTFVKEHPVETVLGVIGIGLGGFGIYKLCTIPQVEVLSVATHSAASQEIITAVSKPSEMGAELAARGYNWHEESHVVSGHCSSFFKYVGSFDFRNSLKNHSFIAFFYFFWIANLYFSTKTKNPAIKSGTNSSINNDAKRLHCNRH